jgi:hypothetical protein
MGQQQLLLVILVTILVGIATVVGINVFGTSAENANQDAVRQDIAQIASSAQGWYIKPTQLGGGGNSFENISFRSITFPADEITGSNSETAENLNASYTISAADADGFKVTATLSSEAVEGTFDTFEAVITEGDLTIGALNEEVDAPSEEE